MNELEIFKNNNNKLPHIPDGLTKMMMHRQLLWGNVIACKVTTSPVFQAHDQPEGRNSLCWTTQSERVLLSETSTSFVDPQKEQQCLNIWTLPKQGGLWIFMIWTHLSL